MAIEETLANAEKLKEEAEIILLKENDLNERNAKLLKELGEVRKGLTEQKEKTDQRRKDGDPIRQEAEVAQKQH